MKTRLYLSYACLLFIVTYLPQSYAAIVIGGSYNTGSEYRPIIAQSFNSGKDWSFPSSITQISTLSPSFAKNGRFSQTICKDTTCVAVGSYEDGTNLVTPLIGVSNNGGKSWSYPQISSSLRNFANYDSARLFSVACRTSQVCIAVGSYNLTLPSGTQQSQALIAITQNSGKNWVFKTLDKPAQLLRIFNYNNNWFVSGVSVADKISTQIGSGLYRSVNDGEAWSLVSSTVINPTAVIVDLKCSGKICLAVGSKVILTLKNGDVTDVKYTPFIATSLNLGATWTVPSLISSTKIQGILLNISCSVTNCMAVGLSGNPLAGSIVRPLAYVTQNLGKTWYASNIFAKAPPTINNLAFAGMTGVACNNAVCFSTGVALKLNILKKQFQLIPFLVVSRDWGLTWTYDKTIALNNANGYIFNPTFNGNVGVVLGGKLNTSSFSNLDLTKQTPFVGISSNNGASWTYPAQIQKPTLSPAYVSFNGFDFISEFSNN